MPYYNWKPYVPVAARRAKAAKQLARMEKQGLIVRPVEIETRHIAATFWGKGWCDHMESFRDYDNRLPRGRTYVRNGSVCHLEIRPGKIEAIVSGSSLYQVEIKIKPLPTSRWSAIRSACAGRIGSLLDLLRGRLESGIMEVVCHHATGLFPQPGEISFQCDCPDWADMCKHVAAVLYGVGARLDQAPEQLFLLRGVDHEELVDIPSAVENVTRGGSSAQRIETGELAGIFGIELVAEEEPMTPPAVKNSAPSRSAASNSGRGKRVKPSSSRKIHAPESAAQSPNPRPAKTAPASDSVTAPPSTFPKRLTGPALRRWRTARNLTQTALAAKLGVTASSISQWENKGRKTLRLREEILGALLSIWGNS